MHTHIYILGLVLVSLDVLLKEWGSTLKKMEEVQYLLNRVWSLFEDNKKDSRIME